MNFSFHRVDAAYCDYLRQSDLCVPYTMEYKSIRPFVGIVFSVHNVHYYAPLTSPKPKHLHMKNQVDFLKINGGKWEAINFNNMIPVHPNNLQKFLKQIPRKTLPIKTCSQISFPGVIPIEMPS